MSNLGQAVALAVFVVVALILLDPMDWRAPKSDARDAMTDDLPKPPEVLNRFVHLVLSYKPKPKSKPAKARTRAHYKLVKIKKKP